MHDPDQVQDQVKNKVLDQLLALQPDWVAESVSSISFLEDGYSNLNYRITYGGKNFVLRLPHAWQPYVDREHENQYYAKLLQHDPQQHSHVQPLIHNTSTGVMLTPWINAPILADLIPAMNPAEVGSMLGLRVRALHDMLPDAHRSYHIGNLADEFVSQHAYTYCNVELSRTCHNDLNPWNVLVSTDQWLTLDWEFVGYNDPVFDLVCLHQGAELPDETLWDMLAAYDPTLVDERTRVVSNLKNFWLRQWSWARFQLDQGNTRAEIVDQASESEERLAQL